MNVWWVWLELRDGRRTHGHVMAETELDAKNAAIAAVELLRDLTDKTPVDIVRSEHVCTLGLKPFSFSSGTDLCQRQ